MTNPDSPAPASPAPTGVTTEQQQNAGGKTAKSEAAPPNQQQEPEPKRESRSRRSGRTVAAGVGINDPDLYARMSAPFATTDEANAALTAFLRAVRALRIKHRIADAVTVALVNVEAFGPAITYGQNGSEEKTPLILAWALGKAEAAAKAKVGERIAAMRASGGATTPPERAPVLASDFSRSTPNTERAP